jgi:hypothetical protein
MAGGVAVVGVVPFVAAGCIVEPSVDEQVPVLAEDASEIARMKAHVDHLYPVESVRHSFDLPSGGMVDCVDRHVQPGLLRPGMEGHVIADPPVMPFPPSGSRREPSANTAGMEAFLVPGAKDAHGMEMFCPDDTIPIRRTTLADAMRFRTLDDMMRKLPRGVTPELGAAIQDGDRTGHVDGPQLAEPTSPGPTSLHQYAYASQSGLANVGAHVFINVWSPSVQVSSEFSLSQLWIDGGAGSGTQTVEAGAQVFSQMYGNSSPHLFIYSTSDNYANDTGKATGCYNLTCGRFIQTNNSVVIGGSLAPISTNGGTQYELEYSWYFSGGNWWLSIKGTYIGYYPGNLFNAAGLAGGSNRIVFGGEIIDDRTKHAAHTTTYMGSGAFPSAGFGHAAFQRNIYYFTAGSGVGSWANGLVSARDNASCYDIAKYNNDANWGTYFYFGGPGYSANCQ